LWFVVTNLKWNMSTVGRFSPVMFASLETGVPYIEGLNQDWEFSWRV
jgi:hypothetical protein